MEEAFVVIFLLILAVGIIAFIIFYCSNIENEDDWVYPDGKKGMVKVKLPNKCTGQPFVISANTESPRWQSMFFKNIEMMKVISCETATKIANNQPLSQEEIDKIQKQSEHLDRKYGTDEEILSGHGYFEDPYFRKKKNKR